MSWENLFNVQMSTEMLSYLIPEGFENESSLSKGKLSLEISAAIGTYLFIVATQ